MASKFLIYSINLDISKSTYLRRTNKIDCDILYSENNIILSNNYCAMNAQQLDDDELYYVYDEKIIALFSIMTRELCIEGEEFLLKYNIGQDDIMYVPNMSKNYDDDQEYENKDMLFIKKSVIDQLIEDLPTGPSCDDAPSIELEEREEGEGEVVSMDDSLSGASIIESEDSEVVFINKSSSNSRCVPKSSRKETSESEDSDLESSTESSTVDDSITTCVYFTNVAKKNSKKLKCRWGKVTRFDQMQNLYAYVDRNEPDVLLEIFTTSDDAQDVLDDIRLFVFGCTVSPSMNRDHAVISKKYLPTIKEWRSRMLKKHGLNITRIK